MKTAATMIRDRKQADGHVIMTKAGYVAWLKVHKDEMVGSVGTSTAFTPISAYALSLGLVFGEQSMPLWARNLRDRYKAVALSGRVRGSQAISEVLEALGYDVYIQFFAS